jgi:hypothetical protein
MTHGDVVDNLFERGKDLPFEARILVLINILVIIPRDEIALQYSQFPGGCCC